MLPLESPIFAEQDDIYIYIFFLLACKIRNTKPIFLAQKVLVGLRVNTHT